MQIHLQGLLQPPLSYDGLVRGCPQYEASYHQIGVWTAESLYQWYRTCPAGLELYPPMLEEGRGGESFHMGKIYNTKMHNKMAEYCVRYSKCIVEKKYPANTNQPNLSVSKWNQTP